MEYEIAQSSDATIVLCTIFSTFIIGWVIFGVKWIIKTANGLSTYKPVK
jgi:heme/copper-type cytochrome/quinol oxidase subunit 4